MVAFVFNGLCTFGVRILAALGLASKYTSSYLTFWYLSGALLLLIVYVRSSEKAKPVDWAIGGGLGLCSLCGQTFIGLALATGLPGHVVFQ